MCRVTENLLNRKPVRDRPGPGKESRNCHGPPRSGFMWLGFTWRLLPSRWLRDHPEHTWTIDAVRCEAARRNAKSPNAAGSDAARQRRSSTGCSSPYVHFLKHLQLSESASVALIWPFNFGMVVNRTFEGGGEALIAIFGTTAINPRGTHDRSC